MKGTGIVERESTMKLRWVSVSPRRLSDFIGGFSAGTIKSTFLLNAAFLIAFLLLTPGCAALPKEVYRGYSGPDLPDASVATVELGNVSWLQIDGVRVEPTKYNAVHLQPATYGIEFGKVFGVSYLVDPKMFVEYMWGEMVTLEAGHTYKLQADRTYGRGYSVYFWIEDKSTGNVVYGTKKPPPNLLLCLLLPVFVLECLLP